MKYLRIAIVALLLFCLTCVFCWLAGLLLQVSPLYSMLFFLFGTLGVVLAIDIVQEWLFG